MFNENDGCGEDSPHSLYTKIYVDILKEYKERIQTSAGKKEKLKEKFFNMIRAIMIALLCMLFLSIIVSFIAMFIMAINKQESVAIIAGSLTAIISSFATIIVSIFKLPEIIARYLFNKKEDKQMAKVIRGIQRYEVDILGAGQANEDATANRDYEEDYTPQIFPTRRTGTPGDKREKIPLNLNLSKLHDK